MLSTSARYAAAGVTVFCFGGCGLYAVNKSFSAAPSLMPRHRRPNDVEFVVQTLGKDLVKSVFRDEEVLADLTKLLVKVFKDPRVTADLKIFFNEQFTKDPRTVAALKQFLVNDVLLDNWVREELLTVSGELGAGIGSHTPIWPDRTLKTLGEAALLALATPEFQEKAMEAGLNALKHWRK